MDDVEMRFASVDPFLLCCLCKRLLHDAVQLKCLHNCCRQCFGTAVSTAGSSCITCSACRVVTQDGSQQPNGFVDFEVRRYRSLAESRVCGLCEGSSEDGKPAAVWCASCRYSLCIDCVAGHQQYNRQHVIQSLEELRSLDDMCTQPSASCCAIHGKPLDIACLNCEQAKCTICWAECNRKKHEMHVVGEKSFDIYVNKFISRIASIESELLRKSEVLQKPKSLLLDTKAARDRHLEEIGARKRRLVYAVDSVYQEIEFSTKNAYDDMEAEGQAAAAVANRINADMSDARNYIRRLLESDQKCEILNQQKIVQERLSALSSELDSLSDRLTTAVKKVKIEASLPDAVEDVIRAWIGMPRVYAESLSPPTSQQQQQQSFSFGAPSATFKLPIKCVDVALTQDGRSLLLASWEHGLIELSSTSGQELCRWQPPKLSSSSSSKDDQVLAVAALGDGRAAVSLYFAQLVVLLRRTDKISGSSTASGAGAAAAVSDDAWAEDRRFQLQCSPYWLSAHGDVLAASCGQRLQLLSLSIGRLLSDAVLQREYDIRSLAVAARIVVTGSWRKVTLGGGRGAAYVLDAYSVDADGGSNEKQLWRHVLSCHSERKEEEDLEEEPQGVCADSCGGCLYAAVRRKDESSGRVSVLSLADGSELRRVALSFCSVAAGLQPLLLPVRLSLCDDRIAAAASKQQQQSGCGRALLLAALCWDPNNRGNVTVTVHRSAASSLVN